MSFNVLRDGVGESGDRTALIDAVVERHNPDLLCVQEGGDHPFWRTLADHLGYRHTLSIPGEFQPALFSRLPVKTTAGHSGVKFVYFQVQLGIATLGVYSLHLTHWPQRDAERAASLRKLFAFIDAQRDPLVCVAGDFNSRTRGEAGLAWGVAEIAKRNETSIGPNDWIRATELMTEQGFADCYRRLNHAPGYSLHPRSLELLDAVPAEWRAWQHTYRAPDGAPLTPPLVRIDYIFANPLLAEHLAGCALDESELALQASDHLPLMATFTL